MYVGDFQGFKELDLKQTICSDYRIRFHELDGMEILAAAGDCGGYEEGHWFLLRRDGELLENDAGHCSCYDFDGQWAPTPTTVAALLARRTITYHAPGSALGNLREYIASLGGA